MEDFVGQNFVEQECKSILNLFNLLNKYKSITIAIITSIFIYFRKLDYYKTMPRKNIYISILIAAWTFFSIIEPWSIIVGLIFLNLFGYKHTNI